MKIRHLTELALIRAIPDLTMGDLKPCRKRALFIRLQKAVDRDLRKFPHVSQDELDQIWAKVEQFGKLTGWLNQTRHVGTLFSFCLAIMENSEFEFNPAIRETINDIIKHLEAGRDFPFQSCWSGDLAYSKWESLFEEVAA